ncbi:MAG TPA: hypothetical protein VI248_10675 [Kineosporiaceae bacterium]
MGGTDRMNREQFYAATARLGEAALRKALWTVYWRGTAAVRERIEDILAPDPAAAAAARTAEQAPDPAEVLEAVREFTGLVRSGDYLGGSRAVRPKERSQWRFTFRRLLAQARSGLAAEDPEPAEAALTEMIDLACEFRDYDYVRSEDPIEAASVVVSDEVAALWRHLLEHRGFTGFAAVAAEQFVRWESRYGWTRSGWGAISQRESQLADVLAGQLTVPDTWVVFTQEYLRALDGLVPVPPAPARGRGSDYAAEQRRRDLEYRLGRRTETLTGWHLTLLDRFVGTDDEALLDRIASHAALGGPEQTYFRARLAHARGDLPAARELVQQALERLPGHSGFLAFARQIDAPLPASAVAVAASRRLPS